MTGPAEISRPADRKLTAANLVTLSRLLLLPLIVIFLLNERRVEAFIAIAVSLATDIVDGFIARRMHQVSSFGKVLDPICDKVSLAVVLVTLLVIGAIPWWVVLIITTRDLLILIGSYVVMKRRRVVFKSNIFGKIAGFLFGAIVLAFTINLATIGLALLYGAIPVMLIAFGTYLYRYRIAIVNLDPQGEK